jgi:glutaredoxin
MTLEDKKAGMLKRKKQEKMRTTILYSVLAIIFISVVAYGINSANTPGELDEYAQCIADSGAVFYGTTWCPYCQQQKQMFGKSQKYLPYVECSGTGGRGISQQCANLGITTVPMWIYNETEYPGMQQLDTLSNITGCDIV